MRASTRGQLTRVKAISSNVVIRPTVTLIVYSELDIGASAPTHVTRGNVLQVSVLGGVVMRPRNVPVLTDGGLLVCDSFRHHYSFCS